MTRGRSTITAEATGAHAELTVASTTMTFDAPHRLADTDAAAFFYPFHLAHLGLHERGRLREGETVLVYAATSSSGSPAGSRRKRCR
jgi:NADPH:quinone reductase-like Zn-dependent oxidoreductase